jgi:hypothetical protein
MIRINAEINTKDVHLLKRRLFVNLRVFSCGAGIFITNVIFVSCRIHTYLLTHTAESHRATIFQKPEIFSGALMERTNIRISNKWSVYFIQSYPESFFIA